MRALYTAATGMLAQELNVEVISNNIANMRTTGFKRQRAEFQDLIYQSLRRVGTSTSDQGTRLPVGLDIGGGVKVVATPRTMSQGSVLPTEKQLDVAIRGEGFFRVQLPDGTLAYSRAGSFEIDSEGRMVTPEGYIVDPAITVPQDAQSITISQAGSVQVMQPGQTVPSEIGQLQLAKFVNSAGLQPLGDNLFRETVSSGAPQTGNPAEQGFGTLLQGHLEQANVESVTEISNLIAAQRAYSMNARVISAADEMLQATAGLSR
jgi:flagellar basal-body rod protein FlgG